MRCTKNQKLEGCRLHEALARLGSRTRSTWYQHGCNLRRRARCSTEADSSHTQAGWVQLDFPAIGLDDRHAFQVHDLLGDGKYLWQGSKDYVELVPESLPAHILHLRRWVRTERDFDYYL